MSIIKKQKRIVVIGGGTGASLVLEGLKEYPVKLTAIVNMFDNGGSSGWFRRQLGVLPPGDLRQCARALSNSEIWKELLEYRFKKGFLKGQCFGNFLISAFILSNLSNTRRLTENWIKKLSEILSLGGKIIPVSLAQSHLFVKLKNGEILKGEDKISASKIISKIGIEELFLEPKVKANLEAIEAIKQADAVAIAPGNLYASIIPCFLANGISKTIRQSRAKKIYTCNLMTQSGHTDGFTVIDYLNELEKYLEKNTINYMIFNKERIPEKILKKYSDAGQRFVKTGNLTAKPNIKFFGCNLLSKNIFRQNKADKLKRTLIRHDGNKIAKAIYDLC